MQTILDNLHAVDPGFGALNAFCLMLFVLFYIPCAATIGTVKKESGSLRFTLGLMAFWLIFAWACSAVVFQLGTALL